MTSRQGEAVWDQTDFPRAIGNPARSALAAVGVTTFAQLTEFTAEDLLAMHGVGPKAVRVLRQELAERGLSLAAG